MAKTPLSQCRFPTAQSSCVPSPSAPRQQSIAFTLNLEKLCFAMYRSLLVCLFVVRVLAELPARRFFVARSCIQKRRLRCCSCRRKAAARFHATRYFCMCLYAAVFDVMRRFSVLLLFLLKVTLKISRVLACLFPLTFLKLELLQLMRSMQCRARVRKRLPPSVLQRRTMITNGSKRRALCVAQAVTPCTRYKANLLKRPRRGLASEEDGNNDAASSSDSDAPISRAGILWHYP
jgi:hypothetical protein